MNVSGNSFGGKETIKTKILDYSENPSVFSLFLT